RAESRMRRACTAAPFFASCVVSAATVTLSSKLRPPPAPTPGSLRSTHTMSFSASLARAAACSAVVLALLTCTLVRPAAAQLCRGAGAAAVACDCGDTVTESTTLAQDLGVCTQTALRVVGTGVVLDCAGHTITGNNESNAKFGIQLDGTTGAEVRNC